MLLKQIRNGILSGMSETILIAGKEFPAGAEYMQKALLAGRSVCITGKPSETENANSEKIIPWNRTSPVSARSVIVQTENTCGQIDEALVIFDTADWLSLFGSFETGAIASATDHMMHSYLYLTAELLSRFAQKNNGRLIFLLKHTPSPADLLTGTDSRNFTDTAATGILPAIAQQQFAALAENLSATYSTAAYPEIILVKADRSEADADIADWLFPFLDALPDRKKEVQKQSKPRIKWIKPGTKPQKNGIFLH